MMQTCRKVTFRHKEVHDKKEVQGKWGEPWTIQFAYRITQVKELLENKIQKVGWNHIMKDFES